MADALQFITDLFVKSYQADEETTPNVAKFFHFCVLTRPIIQTTNNQKQTLTHYLKSLHNGTKT